MLILRLKWLHIGSGVTIFEMISKHMGRMLKCVVRDILIYCPTRMTG